MPPKPEAQPSYFQQRMALLGITDDKNKVALRKTVLQHPEQEELVDVPIFTQVTEGIDILVYTLDRLTIRIEKTGSRQKKDFSIVRLEKPLIKPNGDTMKYRLPKGGGTYPFFPPHLIEKFEAKQPIETLYLVEGYFKAFKAAMHGADIIGLSSITHMKDKDTGALHPDILKLMITCEVKRMVWLTDGDALDITQKELTDGMDLYKRPRGFFKSVQDFKTLLDDYADVEKWFMHIDTDAILQSSKFKGTTRDQVKGIDDLLITAGEGAGAVINDLTSVSSSSIFFQKFNITYGLNKVYNHFHLRDVKDFYLFHQERRPELKNKEFIFNGTRYKYDEEKGECEVKIPGDAKLYFRVADDYYKFVKLPNQYKQLETVFHQRKKTTIVDDHGKTFARHIPKYEAFCNVPDHNNFQQVIHNCFNVYSPVDFIPDDEECFAEDFPTINSFIYHIFGESKTSFMQTVVKDGKEVREKREYSMVELGYDYFQLLYQKPWQKLPILCPVSRENNTGKTTVGNFLRLMLGANVAIVGNADLVNDFNAHWVTKSVVVVDETKIDKLHGVIEKIKNLSTAKKVYMNAKGRGQVELDCFIKFILITNNEESFIYATDDDIRYWVIKVPVLKNDNPNILDQFVEEMPAFLSFLNKRKLVTEMQGRMWFHPNLIKTEALRKVIAYSQPTIEKELRQFFKELFLDTGLDIIEMTQKVVHKEVFNNKFEKNYLDNILKNNLKLRAYHIWKVDGLDTEYATQDEAIAAAGVRFPDDQDYMLQGRIQPVYKPKRYSYPRWEEVMEGGKKEMKRFEISDTGRPLQIYRKDFVRAEDEVEATSDNKFISTMSNNGSTEAEAVVELPF